MACELCATKQGEIIIKIISEWKSQIKFNFNQVRNFPHQIKEILFFYKKRKYYIEHGMEKKRDKNFHVNGSCDEREMKAKEQNENRKGENRRRVFEWAKNFSGGHFGGGVKLRWARARRKWPWGQRERASTSSEGKLSANLSAKQADDWGRCLAKMAAECWKL